MLQKSGTLPVHHKGLPQYHRGNGLQEVVLRLQQEVTSGQSYKASTIVIYDSLVVHDLKMPHITTLDS